MMKKRWIAALLALVLAAALLPGPALAATDSGLAGSRLTGVDRTVYDVLRTEIIRIAAGQRTNTVIAIPDQSALAWNVSELEGAGDGQDILARLKDKFNQTLHLDLIYTCLSSDLPYEMCWKGNEYTWGYTTFRKGDRVCIRDLTVCLLVARGYQGGSETTVNSTKISAARQAADNARAIVERYRDLPDHEKLAAYRREICQLTDYDQTARSNGPSSYGDPWQLVYVFDGDPATNVVCEGYAKAFQYLCDLSDFQGNVACRTITGTMNGFGHMWNVVRMDDGQNYLVDVTNCDSGAIGADDLLFLSGAAPSNAATYTVAKGRCRAVYTYWAEQENLFTDGYLALSPSDYVYDPSRVPAAPAFDDVDPTAYYADSVAWAVRRGITRGTSETAFSPEDSCTHAQILTFLWRAAGQPESRADAPIALEGGEFYARAVRWAAGEGWLGADFDPDRPCDRLSAVEYIWRAFGSPGVDDQYRGTFTDVSSAALSPAGEAAVYWAVSEGVTQGTSDTTFSPSEICTRGQIVTFLYRAYL